MKIILLAIIPFMLLVFGCITVNAQTKYLFTYDQAGGRKTRLIYISPDAKSATIPKDSLMAKELERPLDDQIGLQKTRIYPNPTKGFLRIDLPELSEQEATIRLYDSNGKLIIQQAAIELNNELNLAVYPTGIYILTIQIGKDDRKEWKIIKQ